MSRLQKHRTGYSIVIAAAILIIGLAAIFWARGFKPNLKTASFSRTGLIVAKSDPAGAQVYLNDRLTAVTDTNITFLDPGTYKVRIQKDGYSTWEKSIDIKADLAEEIEALLFPLAPQISPMTATGAHNPTLSPDKTKIAFGTPGERGGAMLISMGNAPFALGQNTRTLARNQPAPPQAGGVYDFNRAKYVWSPDSKQIIATFTGQDGQAVANILLDSDRSQQELRDITGSLNSTIASWQEELVTQSQAQAVKLPDDIKTATAEAKTVDSSQSTIDSLENSPLPASDSRLSTLDYFPSGFQFSPDDEKVLFKNKESKYQVYDLKLKKSHTLPEFSDLINISWYPDSNHLVLVQKNQISIIETDGGNKMVVYSGKFENGFVYPNPQGTRLILLTTLAQPDGTPPNLYAINLK